MRLRLKTFGHLFQGLRDYYRRHWQGVLVVRERLRLTEEVLHLLLAGGVGMIGGLTNLAFYGCNNFVQWALWGRTGELVEIAEQLAVIPRLLAPAAGGLVAGMILYWGLRWVGKQQPSHFLEVVVAGDGRLPMRTPLLKALSSLVSISSGASIGREGAITQLTATFASQWGQVSGWQPYRLRLLVACGAAAGMAAAYNAPVSGAVFAAQIVLGNFSMNLFAPLLFSSVVATMVSRSFFGIAPWYQVPAFDFTSVTQLPWFLLLGILCGILGAMFLKSLRQAEHWFSRIPAPLFVRMALGGLLVGVIAVRFPQVWGNGYAATNQILHERPELIVILGLFMAKLVATSVTAGSGAVGGIFTPTLFLGAALGSLFGVGLHEMGYARAMPAGAFGLVGMGSVLAATVHSPLLAIIMVFEISLNHSILPALMVACAVSTLVGRALHRESVYTEPLDRKGVKLEPESTQVGAAMQQTVGDLMRSPVPPLRETTTFRQIADRFLTSPNNYLPVVDSQQRLLGVVVLHDLKEHLHAGVELASVIAFDIMRPIPVCLTPNQRLLSVFPTVLAAEIRNIPVVNNLTEYRLVGTLMRSEALGVLSEAISIHSTARS